MNLISLADNLWTATQPLRFLGLEVGTRMVVVRLNQDDLILISPIRLEESDVAAIGALGTVRHLIAPNLFHHLFLKQAQSLFPTAKVWGVEGLVDKCPDLELDALLNQIGNFDEELDYFPFEGFGTILPGGASLANETVFLHRSSRSLILTDTAFNFDEESSWEMQLAAQALGFYKALRPSYLEKWGSPDKEKVEVSVRHVLEWDFDSVIPAHGNVVETGGKAQFKAGYEWFLGHSLDEDV
ncbi:hypothetical protein C1752_04417 [Acaryochloris thomasi RCC1774]|uniref:DUF4336 domain-containing protein n=1 Tax=Acaryochloris thomasi RCC1774 TaxID=1764569 RepID=A0A2W1JP53_9CYAN|nr:DUF4336 domain-containing protein [Acaryochloris thomasi]PZD71934.1 hypothetical protein C1752_04417 [Acaryochloris thomasi RCC1774]